MTITFNSNIASLLAQRQLSNATRLFETSLIRLSSGSRINRPSDDAAGLGLSSALGTRARVYNQAVRNGNDVISMLNVAQGGLQEFSGILIRIKELAEQAANGKGARAMPVDVYALGLTILEVLLGTHPFESLSEADALKARIGVRLNKRQKTLVGFRVNPHPARLSSGFRPPNINQLLALNFW